MIIRALPVVSFALSLPLNCAYSQPQSPGERTELAQIDTNTQGGVQYHRYHYRSRAPEFPGSKLRRERHAPSAPARQTPKGRRNNPVTN